MKHRIRPFKLLALVLVFASYASVKRLSGVSAHEGHSHAPASAKLLRNPLQPTDQNIENGKALFEQYCAVCHGADGTGSVYNRTAKITVPDLSSHYVMDLTEGEIFYVATNGIKASGMPAFKAQTSDRERWQLTLYVKNFSIAAQSHTSMAAAPGGETNRPVVLRFKPMVGDKPFACGESYPDIGVTHSTITPTDFRLYVHNVRLVDAAGKETPVALAQDGKWQFENLALLDFENGSGPCSNGTPETHDYVKGAAPPGNYTGVRFTVGVPFNLNHAEPAKQPSPLNLTQMFWVWNVGYKFMRIEVKSTGMPQGWFVHLGSTGCTPNTTRQTVPTSCAFPNRPEVSFNNFDIKRDVVILDLKKLLEGANVDTNQPQTPEGCMSGQKDSDCAPVFANLGLPFGVQPASEQKFFSVGKGSASDALNDSAHGELKASVDSSFAWNLPRGFPKPRVPADNPMTEPKVELGRDLFYDTRLSVTGKFSCASCHDQSRAFTDGKAHSIGATGQGHPRGSMSLANVAYTPVLTWANPNMRQLERQALVPMFGEHPVEMGLSGKDDQVVAVLKPEPRYQKLFPAAFPGQSAPFTIDNVTKAIAAFERTLISGDSAYDRYLNGDRQAISDSAKRGEALFFSERLECFHCHGGFNFSQSEDHDGKAFVEIEFHNTGLYNLDGKGAFPKDNQGIIEFTGRPEDMGKFRAPTLRNVAVTAPYMHDGSIKTLEEAIDHYAAGGRTISTGEYKGDGNTSPLRSAFVKGFTISVKEKRDLIAFLTSLTDQTFLHNPRFSNPWPDNYMNAGRSPGQPFMEKAPAPAGSDDPATVKQSGTAFNPEPLPNPAGPGAVMPHLTVTPDQRLLMSWLEPRQGDNPLLRYAIEHNGNWTEPQTVSSRDAIVDYQSARPAVVLLADGNLIACWEQYRREHKSSSRAIDSVYSVSRDGGKTWTDPNPVHRDQTECSHDFVSITSISRDTAGLIWLDGRNMKKESRQMLMTATVKTDGSLGEEKILDPDVCSCCPPSIVKTNRGLLVAYRDHEPGEIRDISLVDFTSGQWGAPRNLHRDSWHLEACPTNGSALSTDGQRVAVVWFTGANNTPAVKAAFSSDGGRSFTTPLILSQGKAVGRTALALLPDSSAAVAWIEGVDGVPRLMVNRVTSRGESSSPAMLGKTGKGFPRIALAGGQLIVAWTHPSEGVKTVVLDTHVEGGPEGR